MQTPQPFSPAASISGAALGITTLLCMQRQSGDVEVRVIIGTSGTHVKQLVFGSGPCTEKDPKLTDVCPCGAVIGGVDRSVDVEPTCLSGTTEKHGCADGCTASNWVLMGMVALGLEADGAFGTQHVQAPPCLR
jgi:hypothetical protein